MIRYDIDKINGPSVLTLLAKRHSNVQTDLLLTVQIYHVLGRVTFVMLWRIGITSILVSCSTSSTSLAVKRVEAGQFLWGIWTTGRIVDYFFTTCIRCFYL